MDQKAVEMMLVTGKSKPNNGFLLFELAVAVAVLSVGLILVLSAFMRSLGIIEYSHSYFKAVLLLENKLCEESNEEIPNGSRNGVFSDFAKGFTWDEDIVNVEQNPQVNQISLKVSWKEKNKEYDIIISTLNM